MMASVRHGKKRNAAVCALVSAVLCLQSKVATDFYLAPTPRRVQSAHASTLGTGWAQPQAALPVFWIQQDPGVELQRMQSLFAALAGRVKATRVHRATEKSATSQLAVSGNATVMPADNEDRPDGHSSCQFTGSEVSRLVSHLTAIRLAYTEGHDLALVMEADARLDDETLTQALSMIKSAPEDWQILQLSTDHNRTVVYGQQLSESDVWISWMPDHSGTASYFINHQGMRSILEQTGRRERRADGPNLSDDLADNTSAAVWHVHEPCMLIPDELLYYSSTTYTAARPVIERATEQASILAAAAAAPVARRRTSDQVGDAPGGPGPLAGSVLVIQASSVFGEKELAMELHRLRADAVSLKRYHTLSAWHVHLVVTPHSLSVPSSQLQDLAELSVTCHVERGVVGRYNKYRFVAPHVENFTEWDHVLLKDSDMRLSGFPWQTFLAKKRAAVIAGPIRQSLEEGLMRNRQPDAPANAPENQQWFQFHQAHRWKQLAPQFLDNVGALEVPFLEMYFTLFDGKFASFFFQDILSAAFVHGASEWGPDLMWCRAAVEWAASATSPRTGCVLVPLVARHEDSRSIARNQGPLPSAASMNVEARQLMTKGDNQRALSIFSRDTRHARWMWASQDYRGRFGGSSNLGGMWKFFERLRARRDMLKLGAQSRQKKRARKKIL